MDEFVTLDSVSCSDIFPNFGHLVFKCSFAKKNPFIFSDVVMVTTNWQRDFVSSSSVCNHKQKSDFVDHSLTDRIGFHSALFPLKEVIFLSNFHAFTARSKFPGAF